MKTRKGFTLVELLIVIAIIGVLAASMSLSAGSATALAKASTIHSNIRNIKSAALIYMTQQGDQFKETSVDKEALEDLVDLDDLNKTNGTDNNIQYAIVAGTAQGAGAYVICYFEDDGDYEAIAKALKNYKNVRVAGSDEDFYTVGSFLYHSTAATRTTGADTKAYDTDFAFPTSD